MSQRAHDWTISVLGSAMLLAASVLSGCGGGSGDGGSGQGPTTPPSSVTPSPPAVAQAKAENTPVDPTLVAANNTFGLNLLNTLIQAGPDTNIAISPTSVAMALQIAYNGAAGTTQTAMAQTLQLGSLSQVSQLNNDNAALLAALLDPDPQVTLTIANSLWVPLSGATVSPTFASADQTYYGATLGDLAQAPADINAWGNTQTNGLIPQILPPDTNLTQAKAILANVVYFKGSWQSGFSPTQTQPAPFTLADGTQTTVNMMEQAQATFPVISGTNFTAISLPYGQGRLSMILVLPNSGLDLGTFISTLTPADIDSWVTQMYSGTVNLFLPRFTTSFSANLIPPLTTLGMGIAFEAGGGDFSGIYPGAYISAVQHDTVVEVDETGTVAAGSTTVVIGPTVVQVPVNLDFNRPFFYTIRDNQTGALLFTGVMVNPNGG